MLNNFKLFKVIEKLFQLIKHNFPISFTTLSGSKNVCIYEQPCWFWWSDIMWKLAVTLLLLASVPSTIAANNTTIAASNTNEVSEASLSRPKRFVLLFCINFPACCDVRGKDLCGFACPKCPLRLDKCKSFRKVFQNRRFNHRIKNTRCIALQSTYVACVLLNKLAEQSSWAFSRKSILFVRTHFHSEFRLP